MTTLRDFLTSKLTVEELKLVPTAFDVIGSREKSVAIIELPEALATHKLEIAEAIMSLHKSVKSVLRKTSPRKGALRLREYELIAGDADTNVLHIESGCRFKLDVQKTYFSQREGAERLRIAELIKPKENVMVFFAGAGPFAIIIAKKARPARVVGIEINHDAIEYFRENVKLNKVDVEIIEGDVRACASKYYDQFDRILMPLPEQSIEYVDEAVKCAKERAVVHMYCFAKEDELESIRERISRVAANLGRAVDFLGHELVLPWGPRIWKTRIDFRVV